MEDIQKNSLDKMAEALNTTFVPSVKETIKDITTKTDNLVQTVNNQPNEVVIANKELIEDEFKNLITKSKDVLTALSGDIKIGSSASMYMAFAEVIKANVNTLKELFNINKSIFEMEMMRGNINPSESESKKTISMTPQQMTDFLDLAKKSAEINRVEADFKISDEDKKDI
jgi:hypothetical protein